MAFLFQRLYNEAAIVLCPRFCYGIKATLRKKTHTAQHGIMTTRLSTDYSTTVMGPSYAAAGSGAAAGASIASSFEGSRDTGAGAIVAGSDVRGVVADDDSGVNRGS